MTTHSLALHYSRSVGADGFAADHRGQPAALAAAGVLLPLLDADSSGGPSLSADERSGLFTSLNTQAVLSISEDGDQCTVGSLFCLHVRDEQVSFEVNLDSVARSGVRIHPSVLQLSRRRAAQP